jgi:hypothetical protein
MNYAEVYGKTCARVPQDIISFQHDPLACAISAHWNDGVEIRELPLKFEIRNGLLYEIIDASGKRMRVVTRIDGNRFNEFWLETVTRPRES